MALEVSVISLLAALALFTLHQYRLRFQGLLQETSNLNPKGLEGQRLLKRYLELWEHLLLFLDHETVPTTSNSDRPALRWSAVSCKITPGFLSDSGAELFA